MEQFPCKIMMVQESYNQQFWAFGLAKNSSLTKVFNHRVFVARQSGIWFSEFNKVRGIKDKGPCQASDGNKGGRYVHHHLRIYASKRTLLSSIILSWSKD